MVGIDKRLQVGQSVTLQDLASGYQISILPPGQPGLPVIEVGPDYVVIDNPEAGVRTRIPAHLIGTVTTPETASQAA